MHHGSVPMPDGRDPAHQAIDGHRRIVEPVAYPPGGYQAAVDRPDSVNDHLTGVADVGPDLAGAGPG